MHKNPCVMTITFSPSLQSINTKLSVCSRVLNLPYPILLDMNSKFIITPKQKIYLKFLLYLQFL